MNRKRLWLAIVLTVATVAVIVTHIIVDRITREPPNYTQIDDTLWLGGYVPEPPPNTRAVLNLCESEDTYRVESHRWEPIRDAEPVPTLDWLRAQVGFIESERAAGRTVFVHCRNGVSRSGMVVVAHIMARNGSTRDTAMAFVRTRRPELRPNPAFMRLLLEWEHMLRGEREG